MVCLVYTTFPSEQKADEIIKKLLSEKLIACGNRFQVGRSFYEWQGEVKNEQEVVAYLKTTTPRLKDLELRYQALHPFDEPCFLVFHSDQGSKSFCDWISEQVARPLPR